MTNALMIVLCAFSLLLAWAMVYAEHKQRLLQAYLAKTFASLCFVGAGFLAAMLARGPVSVTLLLMMGLVLGMLGDIFLCRRNIAKEEYWDPLVVVGGAFFLIGHLCYFVAFFKLGGIQQPLLYLLIPALALVTFALLRGGLWTVDANRWIGYIAYAAVSGLMLAAGLGVMLASPAPQRCTLAAAAILFVFSDLTLGTWRYSRLNKVWLRVVCITAYYAAQLLFVISIRLGSFSEPQPIKKRRRQRSLPSALCLSQLGNRGGGLLARRYHLLIVARVIAVLACPQHGHQPDGRIEGGLYPQIAAHALERVRRRFHGFPVAARHRVPKRLQGRIRRKAPQKL